MKTEFLENKNEKNKKKIPPLDFKLLTILTIILTLGTLMIFSASYPYAQSHYNDGAYYIKRKLIFLILGLIAMLVTSRLSVKLFYTYSVGFYILCCILLVIVLFGGFSEGVARRWLGIPGTPLSFQPSELMKLGIILILSWYISKNQEGKRTILNEIIFPIDIFPLIARIPDKIIVIAVPIWFIAPLIGITAPDVN